MITTKKKRGIRKKSFSYKPTVRIGKEGATTDMIKEISRQLNMREIVKAKVLRSALTSEDVENIASKIAQRTKSSLIEIRGHTFLLYKQRKKDRVSKI